MDALRKLGFDVYDFCVALGLRLRGDMEVATLHALLDTTLVDWQQRIEAEGLEEETDELWPLWLGLIQNVIEHSPWTHSLACPYCRNDLHLNKVSAGELDRKIRELIEAGGELAEPAELYFYTLTLRANEPYEDFRIVRGHDAALLLENMSHPLTREEAETQALSPAATTDPLIATQEDLDLPREAPVQPMGPVGQKWEVIETFYAKNHLDPYSVPWYLMIGASDTGKTALLRDPDLDLSCITDDGVSVGQSFVVEGWYRAGTALILNIPGLYIDPEASSSDTAQWNHLLDLLRTHRHKRPLDGLIMTVATADLLVGEDETDIRARHYSALLQQIYQKTGCRLPVYLFLTKADQIYGFAPFALALTNRLVKGQRNDAETQRKGPFGWSATNDLEDGYSEPELRHGFREMLARVEGYRPWLMDRIDEQADLLAAFGFANELADLENAVEQLLGRMLVQYGEKPIAFFRGYYFVSIDQGEPAYVKHYNNHQPYERAPVTDSDRHLFLAEVMERKVFAERGLVRKVIDPEDTLTTNTVSSRWKRILWYAAVLFAVFGTIWMIAQIWRLESILTIETDYGSFAFIPSGEFEMGSSATDPLRYPDELPHDVAFDNPFYLGKTEVTQRVWGLIYKEVADNPSVYPGQELPVDSVTWNEAMAFTRRASDLDETGSYTLPTESRWEYASRAGTRSIFPANLDNRTWYSENSMLTTRPVATRSPNEWGLYDMAGNVPEWCLDYYDPVYPPSVAVDPVNEDPGLKRVLRGGAFYDQVRPLRHANRDAVLPDNATKLSGFRMVYIPDELGFEGNEIPTIMAYFRFKVWFRENRQAIWAWITDLFGSGADLVGASADLIEETISGGDGSDEATPTDSTSGS